MPICAHCLFFTDTNTIRQKQKDSIEEFKNEEHKTKRKNGTSKTVKGKNKSAFFGRTIRQKRERERKKRYTKKTGSPN